MKKISSILLLLIAILNGAAQEISFPKPYEYHKEKNGYVVKSVLSFDDPDLLKELYFQNEKLDFKLNETGDVETYLPLVGDPMQLKIVLSGKNNNAYSLMFSPLIPSNWGYFNKGKVHIICSSHQDIAWMNTPDSCKHERVYDIVLPALDLIEKNPEFKFEMEQTLNLMETVEEVPESKQRIIDAYESGNFSWGATLTQPYEGLESGEQLVRQTYFGRKWIKDNFPGMDAEIAYNIDVPGRSMQVPQILNKAGIDYLFVSRMKEGFYDWYSPDGSKVLTYSPGNYGWSLLVYKYLEEDAVTAIHKLGKLMKNWDEYYRERNIPPHYAIVISTDAGGPKYYEEIINNWNEIANESGFDIPQIQHSTAEDFLGEIDVPEAHFDSIYGERPNLWLYIHGAAHYQAIKEKKAAAVSVPAAEMFSTINCLLEDDFSSYPSEELNKAWYSSIYPDHGWGGKNGAITDSIFEASLKEGNRIGKKLLTESTGKIAAKIDLRNKNNILVFNYLSWNKTGHVSIDISDKQGTNWVVLNKDNKEVPSQISQAGNSKQLTFEAKNVPSVGYVTYHLKNKKSAEVASSSGSNFIENKFYKVQLGNGGITSLFDKELGENIINSTRFAAGDLLHMGYNGNGAGEFNQITEPNVKGYEKLNEKNTSWKLLESGDVFSSFQTKYQMNGFSVIQKIILFHHKKQIDFEYDILNWEGIHNRQLRAAFPLNLSNQSQISYDIPMGMVHVGKDELKNSPGGWSWEGTYHQKPEFIHPREIQNFMTINDNNFGVTMSTDIVTADWIDPSREAVDYPVLQAILLSTHKSCHGLGNWYEQKGDHHFKISLCSHDSGWKNGFHFGVESNHPFITNRVEKSQKGKLPAEKSFIKLSSKFTSITSFKKAEDGTDPVLRILETEGKDKNLSVDFYWDIQKITKTNLIEEEISPLPVSKNILETEIGKNAIETFKLNLNSK